MPAAEEGEAPVLMLRGAGPFLLIDRPDPERFFETAPSTAPKDFAEFLKEFKPFSVSQKSWNKMRYDEENGLFFPEGEGEIAPLPVEQILVSSETPKTLPPEVELPSYGTSLSVTGRKVVGFSFSEKRFLNDQKTSGRPKSLNLIDIQQQLQLRMQGKVGPKITVNVDYDDTKLNKQDISVSYTGDPNEVVQNASFGDIDLSLPATEFVSYNKQLFGIRADIKHKGLKASFIGSRTKGTTKSKEFIGNSQFASVDILDTAYVRRQYYDLTFGNASHLPIQPGTERIFLSQQDPKTVNANSLNLTVDDLAVASSSFTGIFNQLAAGQDYTIDYVKGIITFRFSLSPQFVAAVDFVDANGRHITTQTSASASGGSGLFKLIKTNADQPISQSSAAASMELGFNRELKTVYSIGQNQIIRDDGRGNFFLKILDPQTRNEIGPSMNPAQKYPDTIAVDFENGLFRLQSPFTISPASPTVDPDLYSPTPISKRLIHLEYHFRLKTFFLEPNLVLQSEVVLVDGLKLSRNVDYFIDYDSGFITFFNEDRIRPTSTVDISYEVAPFSGVTSESILGTRVSYDFSKHFSLGSTLLYDAAAKPPTTPSISDLAKSLLIYDFDSQLKDVRLFSKLKGTFQGEYAHSIQNPNLNKFAIIDNMESVKQEDVAGLLAASWQIASNPTGPPADPQALNWINEDVPTLQINPKAQANANDNTKALDFQYNFGVNGTTETSIVYVFSPTGLDFSQKSILEAVMLGDNSGNEINFTLGGINEDADGTGGMTLNCADGTTRFHAPKTEDVDCDGILQPSEDIGFPYAPVGLNSTRYGAGNGRIDSMDLNKNGILDPADLTGDSFGYAFSPQSPAHQGLFDVTSASTRTAVDFDASRWHTFQIPLGISSATFNLWTAVKELRISIRHRPGAASSGVIKFARLAVVGNTWQRGQAGDPSTGAGAKASESLSVTAVNNVDNPGYIPIFNAGGDAQNTFNDLYGSVGAAQAQSNTKNLSEQALSLFYQGLTQGATVYTRRPFVRTIDVSQHKNFNFLLFGNPAFPDPSQSNLTGDKVFFLRAGSDTSFFEVRIPLNFTGWRRFSIRQVDTTGSQVPDSWALGQGTPGTVVLSSGIPNLQQISELVAGLYGVGGSSPTQGLVYLDEIYVSDPLQRIGTAQKVQMDFDVAGWATFGGKYRSVDRNYQTPTTVVSNQDSRLDAYYLNFTRLAFLPLTFNLSRSITLTPNVAQTGTQSNLINLLQGGKVTSYTGAAAGNFNYGAFPRLSLNYSRARTEYKLLTRLDDNSAYNSALSYGVPIHSRFLPKTVDLTYSFNKHRVAFERLDVLSIPGNFNTDEFTKSYGARLSFVPWGGSSFNPNASLTTVNEIRDDFTSGSEVVSRYPKSLGEGAGFSSNFRLLSWLNPSISYNASTIENNLLSVSTFVVSNSTHIFNIGDLKTINRSANGSVSLPLNVSEIFAKTKLFRSLSFANGYQTQDGDVWNNVEKELSSRFALIVRTPLRPASPLAQRANLTLRDTFNSTQRWSPLEAYAIKGRPSAFKTLSLTNNYLKSIQRSEVTGTRSKTISLTLPDAVGSLSQLEKLLYSERWMANGQLNLKYSAHRTENVGTSLNSDNSMGTDVRAMIRKRFDVAVSFNVHDSQSKDLIQGVVTQKTHHEDATTQTTFDVKQVRFTPKVDYSLDTAENGQGIQTQNLTTITPSVLMRADLALPRGLVLPFTGKTILFSNRIIWTNTMSLALRSSPVTQADNSKLFNLNTSADYEIAKNLRMSLNGAVARLWHKFLKEEDFISYQFGTTLTFQF